MEKDLKKERKEKEKNKVLEPPPECLKASNESYECNSNAKPQGRRWSLNIELLALNMYRRSPRAYAYLQGLLFTYLPTIATISLLSRSIVVHIGINQILLDALTKNAQKMSELDRHCVILFDEMSINPRLLYDEGRDRVIGYQDYGKDMPHLNKSKVACKALIFMIRGPNSNWKQPFVYYFNEQGAMSFDLIQLIPEVINAVNATGFKVRGIIADQASTNESALNGLITGGKKIDTQEHPYFFVGEEVQGKIYVVFDWPHMIQCFRNNWLGDYATWQKNNLGRDRMSYPGNVVFWGPQKIRGYWKHIMILFSLHQLEGATTITENMMFPLARIKMRVCYTVRLLSATVSRAFNNNMFLKYFKSRVQNIPATDPLSDCSGTQYIIAQINCLFDYVNGPSSSEKNSPPERCHVTAQSEHVQVWNEYRQVLKETKIETRQNVKVQERTINNMVKSLMSMKLLWQDLRKDGFNELDLRNLNQDPLENFNGLVRQQCGTNDNPTAVMFESSLKSILVTRFSAGSIKGTNCTKESSKFLIDQHDLIRPVQKQKKIELAEPELISSQDSQYPCLHIADYDSSSDGGDMYDVLCEKIDNIPGSENMFLISKIFRHMKFSCEECREAFIDNADNSLGPSQHLQHVVRRAVEVFDECVIPCLHDLDIGKQTLYKFKDELKTDWLDCTKDHRNTTKDKFLRLMARLLIERECGRRNAQYIIDHARATNAAKISQQAFRNHHQPHL